MPPSKGYPAQHPRPAGRRKWAGRPAVTSGLFQRPGAKPPAAPGIGRAGRSGRCVRGRVPRRWRAALDPPAAGSGQGHRNLERPVSRSPAGEKFMNDPARHIGVSAALGSLLPWRRLCSATPRTSREGRARPLSARQEIDLSHLLIPDRFCFTKPKDAQADDDIAPVPSPVRLGWFEESKSRLCCIDGLGTDFLFLISQNTYCHDLLVLVFCFWKYSKI